MGVILTICSVKRAFHILRILNLLYIIWAILTIELTINWNNVQGVTGSDGLGNVGQQLPAMIGAFSLIRSVWLIAEEWWDVSSIRPSALDDY